MGEHMDSKKLVKDELIGRQVTITECSDPSWVNTSGVILDETKQTFLIEYKKKRRRIAKKIATFAFTYNENKIIVKGTRLVFRPEDRIKKAR